MAEEKAGTTGLAAMLGNKLTATAPAAENQELPKPPESHEAEEAVAEDGAADFKGKIYTCLPLRRLQIGKFKFVDGQLRLSKDAEIKSFEKLLDTLPEIERNGIKTVDLGLAQQIAGEQIPAATRGMDSGHSAAEDKLKREAVRTGTEDLGTKDSGN